MNYISPCNHPESQLSGSTIESMIDKTKKLGLKYFAYTDHGMMTGLLRAYKYAKDKEIKLIPGIEIFFKDNDCPIIKGTQSERIKYFKAVIHAKDQESFQNLVKITSNTSKKKIFIGEEKYPIFNWADLEEIFKNNVTFCTSDIECIVNKHLLVGRADLAVKYYEKIRNMVGKDNFYPTIIPFSQDMYWNKMVEVNLGKERVQISANDRVWTDSKFNKNYAKDLIRPGHKKLTDICINGVKYPIKKEFQDIKSAKMFNGFTKFPNGDVQLQANKFIFALSKKFGDTDRLLINNYSYHSDKEDKIVQDMKTGESSRSYPNQFIAETSDVVEYLTNSIGIDNDFINKMVTKSHDFASKFDNLELSYKYRLPDCGENPEKKLIEVIHKVGRMKWDDERYKKQLAEEYDLLTKNGVINLIPYFLPIVDIYDYYNKSGHLTGPARGSAGGFLISYLIGITHVDPIKYGLSSSRFLTLDRIQSGNIPDIDCDLQSRDLLVGKDKNSGYLFEKYGNKAAQVSTRTLLRIKSAILDANRFIHGKIEEDIQQLSKSLPNTPQGVNDHDYVFGYENDEGVHVTGLIEKNEDLRKYAQERPKEWDLVKRALSLSRQNSRHACAFLISNSPIEDVVPIMEVGGVKRVTQPEAKQCEWAGLIKYDFLVISVLKDINLCLRLINKKNQETNNTGYFSHNGEKVYIWDLPEDKAVFDDLGEGKTESVFQLNTTSVTPFVKSIKPQSIIDCATITSLVRPGPLDFVDEKTGRNMVEEYVERRFGRSKGDIEILNKMLPETYGVLVYQEQVTRISKELGGMSVIEAENVRIGMGKKKKKLIESLKPIFIEGASKKVDVNTATKIWEMMETFAGYGFNKSHAVAYSVVSYACAFLKHYYPLEWWASVLSNADDKEINEVFYKHVKDMVMPPDINTSTEIMEVDYKEGKIRNKLSMINGLGTKVAEKITGLRPYKDINDFVRKKPCGDSLTKKLIHVGVLDSLFDKDMNLSRKMLAFERASLDFEIEEKIKEYDRKISGLVGKEKDRVVRLKDKYVEKSKEKLVSIDPMYIALSPKRDFLIKKSIFPTMNLDLQSVLDKDSKTHFVKGGRIRIIKNMFGVDVPMVGSEEFQLIEAKRFEDGKYYSCAAYILDTSEFTYKNGEKKALKILMDISGYVCEKVLWTNYITGGLEYPKSLKKGCIAYVYFYKKAGKDDSSIVEINIEEESIL